MKVQLFSVNSYKLPSAVTPTGAACVAGAARAAGHQVAITDLCFERDVQQPIWQALGSFQPDVIGISIRNLDNVFYFQPVSFMPRLKDCVDACRAKSAVPIVLGGAGFSILPEDVLDYCGLTLGIRGEGEKSFPMLLDRIQDGRSTADVPGLVSRNEKGWIRNRYVPPHIDDLPSPALDLLDKRYSALKPTAHAGLETKRGCAFNCTYCVYPTIQGHELRFRSPKRVAREVKALVETVGPEVGVDFVDNVFNFPIDHAIEVCDALIAERVRAKWDCVCFNPACCSDKLLSRMVEAGCQSFQVGVDTGSEKMLKVLDKGFDRATLTNTLRACKATGVLTSVTLLFGAPGEDTTTVEDTLSLMEDLGLSDVCVMYGIRVYPGTPLEKMLDESRRPPQGQGWLKPWFCAEGFTDEMRQLIEKYLAAHPTWIAPGMQAGRTTPGFGQAHRQ